MTHGVQIGMLARDTGFSVDAIRFYEKEGLLREPPRSQGGFRLYTTSDADHLHFIRRAQELGFSLAEVRELLLIQDENTQACVHVRDLIRHKLDSVGRKMADLKKLERSLKSALGQCENALERKDAQSSDCCPVLEKFVRTNHKREIPHEN
jgi:MerR family transcriptional regulator, mercuric resistance operon regulatory protein